MTLSGRDIADAMVNGIRLPNTREDSACFIKLSLPDDPKADLIYDIGAWGSVLSSMDGGPQEARDAYLKSGFNDKLRYVCSKVKIELQSAMAIHILHQKKDIRAIAELLRNGDIELAIIH